MQGINKAKHVHLIDALLGLERLVIKQGAHENCVQEVAEHRARLENIFGEYERLLTELAKVIIDYETLYSNVKVQFLAKKLKSLKKEIAIEKSNFIMLRSNSRLAYGT